MFWLDRLMEDFNIKTRYELSKKTGVGQTTLSTIVKNQTPVEKVKFGIIRAFSKGVNIELNELNEKLIQYEEKTPSNG